MFVLYHVSWRYQNCCPVRILLSKELTFFRFQPEWLELLLLSSFSVTLSEFFSELNYVSALMSVTSCCIKLSLLKWPDLLVFIQPSTIFWLNDQICDVQQIKRCLFCLIRPDCLPVPQPNDVTLTHVSKLVLVCPALLSRGLMSPVLTCCLQASCILTGDDGATRLNYPRPHGLPIPPYNTPIFIWPQFSLGPISTWPQIHLDPF